MKLIYTLTLEVDVEDIDDFYAGGADEIFVLNPAKTIQQLAAQEEVLLQKGKLNMWDFIDFPIVSATVVGVE